MLVQVAAGAYHTLALSQDGVVLGIGQGCNPLRNPVVDGGAVKITHIAAGGRTAIGLCVDPSGAGEVRSACRSGLAGHEVMTL